MTRAQQWLTSMPANRTRSARDPQAIADPDPDHQWHRRAERSGHRPVPMVDARPIPHLIRRTLRNRTASAAYSW
jgi:hypothetical protein